MDTATISYVTNTGIDTNYSNESNSVETNDGLLVQNVIVIVIGILSVLANSFLLFVMHKDPLKAFQTKISCLVKCLALADCLTGLNGVLYGFLQPMKMYHISLWYMFWTSVMVSVLTVFGMCVERWFAILHPFKSSSIVSRKLTLYFGIGSWILCAGLATSIHFLPRVLPFVLTCFLEIFLLIIVLLYVDMLIHLRKTLGKSNAITTLPRDVNTNNIGETKNQSPRRHTMAMETQLFKVLSILVLILFLTFIPYNLGTQITYGYVLFRGETHAKVSEFLRYFFPLKFLNFLLNPFVYAWRLRKYRKSFTLVLCKWKGRRIRVHDISNSSKENNRPTTTVNEVYRSHVDRH